MGWQDRNQRKNENMRAKQEATRNKLMGKAGRVSDQIRLAQVAAGGKIDDYGNEMAASKSEREAAYEKLVRHFDGNERKARKAMEQELEKFGAKPKLSSIRRWWG